MFRSNELVIHHPNINDLFKQVYLSQIVHKTCCSFFFLFNVVVTNLLSGGGGPAYNPTPRERGQYIHLY